MTNPHFFNPREENLTSSKITHKKSNNQNRIVNGCQGRKVPTNQISFSNKIENIESRQITANSDLFCSNITGNNQDKIHTVNKNQGRKVPANQFPFSKYNKSPNVNETDKLPEIPEIRGDVLDKNKRTESTEERSLNSTVIEENEKNTSTDSGEENQQRQRHNKFDSPKGNLNPLNHLGKNCDYQTKNVFSDGKPTPLNQLGITIEKDKSFIQERTNQIDNPLNQLGNQNSVTLDQDKGLGSNKSSSFSSENYSSNEDSNSKEDSENSEKEDQFKFFFRGILYSDVF